MKKRRILLVFMALVMLAITGFQAHWLRDNYNRQKHALIGSTDILFRETVRQLQDSLVQARLQQAMKDSGSRLTIKTKKRSGSLAIPAQQTARVIHMLGQTVVADSIRRTAKENSEMYISVDPSVPLMRFDSTTKVPIRAADIDPSRIREMHVFSSPEEGNAGNAKKERDFVRRPARFVELTKAGTDSVTKNHGIATNTILFNNEKGDRIVIRVDSLLNDTLAATDLVAKFTKVLEREKIDVPFTVTRDTMPHRATLGRGPEARFFFAGDSPYDLVLGNSVSYLFRQITLPVIFSIFLVGITVLCFILLYRSMVKQYRLGQMKNDLISNITHELKTPLATVGVALEALKNFNAIEDPARTREYLDISQNELHRLNLLVDKVLKLSIFEKQQLELKKETFDVKTLALEIINTMKLQFDKYRAAIDLRTEGEQFVVEADKLHISSVIYNLLDNALKYSSEKPEVSVFIRSQAEHLEISVKDNGIGIPAEYRSKVFDKFFRVPTGDRHNAKGYGLGLSYVSEVIKRHHGFITVDSQFGVGSTFTVFLPYKELPVIHFGEGREIRNKKFNIGN